MVSSSAFFRESLTSDVGKWMKCFQKWHHSERISLRQDRVKVKVKVTTNHWRQWQWRWTIRGERACMSTSLNQTWQPLKSPTCWWQSHHLRAFCHRQSSSCLLWRWSCGNPCTIQPVLVALCIWSPCSVDSTGCHFLRRFPGLRWSSRPELMRIVIKNIIY